MSRQPWFWIGAVGLTLIYVVWVIIGPNSFVMIHDNLDGEFVYLKFLLESDDPLGLCPGSTVPHVMNGLPRSAFRSGLNVTVGLFALLPPLTAYLVNHFLVHFAGYAGMYLLLQQYVVPGKQHMAVFFGLCWGLTGYYHLQYGLSIAGQPLLLWALLNILQSKSQWWHWVVIAVFPFWSFLLVTLPYFLPLLALVACWYGYRSRQVPWAFVGACALLAGLNIVSEYSLLAGAFGQDKFVSHRTEWQMFDTHSASSVTEFVNKALANITEKQYHPGSLWRWPVLVLVLLVAVTRIKINRVVKICFALLVFITLWVAVNDWFVKAIAPNFELIIQLNSKRFFFLAPAVWTVLMAALTALLLNRGKWQRIAGAIGAGSFLVGVLWLNPEVLENLRIAVGNQAWPTYSQFMAEGQLRAIKQELGPDTLTGRFAALGIHPSVLQHNGLSTLDGYQNNYPLEYKHKFRDIIAPELSNCPDLAAYFDNFGSRVYLFSCQLGKRIGRADHRGLDIQEWQIDTQAFRNLGGTAIISAHKVLNADSIGLTLKGTYPAPGAWQVLYLYRVDGN